MSTGEATEGDSGAIYIGSGQATGGRGGAVSISVGSGESGTGGDLRIIAGATTTTDGKTGGKVRIHSGAGLNANSGYVQIATADGGTNGVSGNVILSTGLHRWQQWSNIYRIGQATEVEAARIHFCRVRRSGTGGDLRIIAGGYRYSKERWECVIGGGDGAATGGCNCSSVLIYNYRCN